jgi:peptidylprolyl isomerase
MRPVPFATAALAALALVTASAGAQVAGQPATKMAPAAGKTMTTASGLQITDSKVGTGAMPKTGQICVMHYTGWLYQNGAKGSKFDSSVDRGEPFEFTIGKRQVIAGWDEGVASMKVGGKRTLIIPPDLGYGARGAGGVNPVRRSRTCANKDSTALSVSRRLNSWVTMSGKRCREHVPAKCDQRAFTLVVAGYGSPTRTCAT